MFQDMPAVVVTKRCNGRPVDKSRNVPGHANRSSLGRVHKFKISL